MSIRGQAVSISRERNTLNAMHTLKQDFSFVTGRVEGISSIQTYHKERVLALNAFNLDVKADSGAKQAFLLIFIIDQVIFKRQQPFNLGFIIET